MIVVHGRNTSVNVQMVMWAIAELNLSHKRLDVGGPHGGTDAPEFRAKNPHGLVPAIEDGETVVWESAAIVRYLAARYGTETFWPQNPSKRAALDMWAEWCRSTLYPAFIVNVFLPLVRTPAHERDAAAMARAFDVLKLLVTRLDARIGKGPYLAGESFSFGDIFAGQQLYRYFTLGFPRAETPALEAYFQRLTQRPAFAEHMNMSFDSLRHPQA